MYFLYFYCFCDPPSGKFTGVAVADLGYLAKISQNKRNLAISRHRFGGSAKTVKNAHFSGTHLRGDSERWYQKLDKLGGTGVFKGVLGTFW